MEYNVIMWNLVQIRDERPSQIAASVTDLQMLPVAPDFATTSNLQGLTFQIIQHSQDQQLPNDSRPKFDNILKLNYPINTKMLKVIHLSRISKAIHLNGKANKSVTFLGSKFLVPDDGCWMAQLNATD